MPPLTYRVSIRSAIVTILCSGAALCYGAGLPQQTPVPEAAKSAVAAVHSAARAKDYTTLRRLMTDEFRSLFRPEEYRGVDTAEQAIELWKTKPAYLRHLVRATGGKCGKHGDQVLCPADAGTSFRAGFVSRGGQWKLTYFLEGD